MKNIDLNIPQGAIFSDDRKYRYALWRIWNPNKSYMMQIGLNPSKANEFTNDPTITRGISRAYQNGFGGFFMGNLYAYVSTDPKALLKNGDFVGEYNDEYLKLMVEMSAIQVCGWGSFPPVKNRASIVYKNLVKPMCLDINADGEPKHPLYVGYATQLKEYKRG